MKIALEKIHLDKDNPRFIIPRTNSVEEEIFEYLKENEVLEELIEGIKRTGFFQIGEKPIVMKLDEHSDEYVVLEGNRRVCALKALHGFYSKKYDFEDNFRHKSIEIDVDEVKTKEEIQPYLAARHIQGIRLWKAEARRNFYYKHYIDNKTLSEIEKITQQKKGEIKKFIKDLVFLDFFKTNSGFKEIDKPSLIYERIQRYMIELKLIQELDISENFRDCEIRINHTMLDQSEFNEFCGLLAEAIFGKERFIDSRSINKFEDFSRLLLSDDVKEKSPRLYQIHTRICHKLRKEKFVPIQVLFNAVKNTVPEVSKIIDYAIISENVQIKIFSNESEISEQEFISGAPGDYTIKINEFEFHFKIIDYLKPNIKIIETPFKNMKIGTTEDISELIHIYDVYGKKVNILDKNVKVISNHPGQLEVTKNKNILINQAGIYTFDVKYSFNNNPDYTITKNVFVEAKLMMGTKLNQYKGFFDFKFVDVSSMISEILIGQLIDELDDNYAKNNLYVFSSALRSVLELALEDFHVEAQRVNPTSEWGNEKLDSYGVKELFFNLTHDQLDKIAQNFCMKMGKARETYNSLRNYLKTNITITSSGHSLKTVIDALHLGAHKSLKNLNPINIAQIQPYFVAWLELIFIIIELQFIKLKSI